MPHFKRKKTMRRPRRRRRRKSSIPKKVTALSRKVGRLTKLIDALDGQLTFREANYSLASANINVAAYSGLSHNTIGDFAVVAGLLKYYDIKIPGTLLTVNMEASSFNIAMNIVMSKSTLKFRSNYSVPCEYTCWIAKLKGDTAFNPVQLMTDQVGDMANVAFDNPYLWPNDFNSVRNLWSLKKIGSGLLHPGEQKIFSYRSPKVIDYEVSAADKHNSTYQRKYDSRYLFVKFQGILAHDSVVTTEQGLGLTCIDVVTMNEYTVKYNAGADLEYLHIIEDGSTFTNQDMLCNRSFAGQQSNTL